MSVEILDLGALALTAVFFALLYYLHKKKHVDFGVRTILAVGLGLIVGLAFKGHHTYVAAVGTIYAHRGYGAYRYERCGCGYRHHPCGRYRRAAGHCRLQWYGGDARGRSLRVTSKKLFATKIQFKKRNQEKHWFAHEKANRCFFLIKERNKMKIYSPN